jgi:phosphoserine phosphatase
MHRTRLQVIVGLTAFVLLGLSYLGCATEPPAPATQAADPLPSWNEGNTKQRIVEFVEAVTNESSARHVPASERIAVFDNDGTLWCEKPLYVQLQFAIDRVREMASDDPQWESEPLFQAILDGDKEKLARFTEEDLIEFLMVSHAAMSTEQFRDHVRSWISTAKHPKYDVLYKNLVYQPMLELLEYMRANGFKTYIVSGGGIEFMRVFTEEVYGIPPEQVIGSIIKTEFRMTDGRPVLFRVPELGFIDDKEGKPVGIHQFIGRRPIAAFGNSDGDLQMLQYTAAGEGARLLFLLHHDDAEREYAYDRQSHIGRLDKALDEAREKGWIVASMKNDFGTVFAK